MSLFVEYQLYKIKGSNTLPDPFIKQEVEILNKIAAILYPKDSKEKAEFIKSVNEILK
mgnify:FL=1